MSIEIHDLAHVYSDGQRALNGVSLTLSGDGSVAIIGQNGAGKTTLVKHFNGILRPTSGSVSIDGVDIDERTTAEWSKKVGYIFQNPDDQLFLESVRKEFEFGPRQIGMQPDEIERRIQSVSALVGLSDKLDIHPFDLTSTEKKFCTIGAVIMMNPQVVIFDEPTCGQDVEGNERLEHIMMSLSSEHKLCVAISHDMKFVTKNFKRVIVMCNGSILLDGSTADVFSRPEILHKSFVSPPPITRVAQGSGIRQTVFRIPDFIDAIQQERNQHG